MAPEVLSQSDEGYDLAVDYWSIGCILVELLVGDVIFQTKDDKEHLAMMERLLGPIPEDLARRAG
jgi:dual-specificity kinase